MVPSAAHAATLVNSDGVLSYTAAPGSADSLRIEADPTGVGVSARQVTTVVGCTPGADPGDYVCAGVHTITATLGDGDDRLHHSSGDVPITAEGGAGDDSFSVKAGDVVRGGDGVDVVEAIDDPPLVDLSTGAPFAEVEDLTSYAAHSVTLIGDAAGNRFQTGPGPDVLVGGPGYDDLYSGDGNDILSTRDGEPDRVGCGPGVDIALVDHYDQVFASCEDVQVATVLNLGEDLAPSLAWTSPAGTSARAGVRTTLQATAGDDRGVLSVGFLDDDRVVCTDTSAPYTCDYRPGADDIGRNTLVAVVTDLAGQTATVTRTITVARYSPRAVTLRVRNGVASGKLELPSGAPCDGTVTIRAASRVKRTAVRRDCTYRTSLRVRDGARVTASFGGSDTVTAKRSATRRAS
jgi:hypothetical protein